MLYKLVVILSDLEYILSPSYKLPRRGRLLRDYTRIRFKAFFNRWFHYRRERFLGYDVEFPDFEVFFAIFRQVFVRQAYYVELRSGTPRIIDCGGNIGMSTLYYKYLYPAAQVLVFEPSREVIDVLRRNIEKNNSAGVTVVNAAVYDEDGKMTIHPRGFGASGNTLDAGIASAMPPKYLREPYQVPVERLSSYIGENETIDILKMDIEGSEGVVLRELELIGRLENNTAIVLEYHQYAGARDNGLPRLLSMFEKHGYEYKLYSDDIAPASEHNISALCIRAQKPVS